jgi:CBS domain-containing protein
MPDTGPATRKTSTNAAPPAGVKTVGDVMTTAVVAAHEGAVFKEIVDSLTRNNISGVPVIDVERRVVGVVSASDLLVRLAPGHLELPRGHWLTSHAESRRKLHAATARELMTAPAVHVTADTPIAEAARLATESRVRRLPVVSSEGLLIGIVTKTDLLRAFLRPDGEILRDVVDNVVVGEFAVDPTGLDITVIEGVVTVSGQMERKQLADYLVESIREVGGVVDVVSSALGYHADDSAPDLPGMPLY